MRHASRTDSNHAEICAAFRELGCTIMDLRKLGEGKPDILVSAGVVSMPVEIKTEKGKLTGSQKKAFSDFTGTIYLVRNADDVAACVKTIRAWRDSVR